MKSIRFPTKEQESLIQSIENKKPQPSLRDTIIQLIYQHEGITIPLLLRMLQRKRIRPYVSFHSLRRFIEKLSKEEIVEFVYIDQSYGARLTSKVRKYNV